MTPIERTFGKEYKTKRGEKVTILDRRGKDEWGDNGFDDEKIIQTFVINTANANKRGKMKTG